MDQPTPITNEYNLSYQSKNDPNSQTPIQVPNFVPYQYFNCIYTPCLSHQMSLTPKDNFKQILKDKIYKEPKRKVPLSDDQKSFKDKYYKVFTSKKRFSKFYVKNIHDILISQLGLRPMTREEFRRIDLYFHNFSKYSNQILDFLVQNKEEINLNIFGNSF